jgi:hypothetical protein
MFTAIALAAFLGGTPAQPGNLTLTNVRTTIGELGPPRDGSKLLPGDILFIAYDIDGLTIDAEGIAKYTMALEVNDAAGKLVFRQDPREMFDFVPLRGNKLPGRGFITVGLDQPPGNYSCKISVTDPKTKATGSLNVKFEVLKKDFGVVAVFTAYDLLGEISAPTIGQVGQKLIIHFSIAAFERDAKTKQPNVEVQFQVYDDKGQPLFVDDKGKVTPRKFIQDAKSANPVKEGDGAFALQFPIFMNRPGKFVVEITATDLVSSAKKQSSYKLPITINPAQ